MLSNPPISPFKKGGEHGDSNIKEERIPSFIKRGAGRLLNKNLLFICFNALITKSQLKYERGEIIIQQSSLPDLIGQSRKKIDFPVKPE